MEKNKQYFALALIVTASFGVNAQSIDDYDDDYNADDDYYDEPGLFDQVVPVAEEDASGGNADDEQLSPDERLASEFDRYRRLVREGALDEADISAKRIVELVIRIHGPMSLETSKALNNLALVQHRTGQYDAAIQNFEAAVEIIETVEDRLNANLVNPLKGLGAAQLSNGRPDLARKSFTRATHISHVNEGPHNIEQVEILESLAQASLLMGDTNGARDFLDRIHVLNVRHFNDNPLALLPSLMRRASWQHAARYFNDERATYRRAINILETKLGKDDLQLIDPLIKLGQSFYFVDLSGSNPQQQSVTTTGEMYFKRATRIAEESPDIEWRKLADTKLALADYYTFVESHSRARKIYGEVWELLSTDAERLPVRQELLEEPVVLVQAAIPQYLDGEINAGLSDQELKTGTIRVDYTVSERGRVRNIRTEAQPPEFTDMQRMVHREIRRRVFRPKFTAAQPQVSNNLIYSHTFFYRQADLDALITPQERPPEASAEEETTI